MKLTKTQMGFNFWAGRVNISFFVIYWYESVCVFAAYFHR